MIKVSKTTGISPLTSSKQWLWAKYGYNSLGQKLWGYFQEIDWSYDGTHITSDSHNRYGVVYMPFWNFIGNLGNGYEQGGVGYTSYRSWTQGQFKLCVSQYGCIQEADPWLDMTVYGNGGYSGSQGG